MTEDNHCSDCKHAEDSDLNYTGTFCTLKNKYVFYPCPDYEEKPDEE